MFVRARKLSKKLLPTTENAFKLAEAIREDEKITCFERCFFNIDDVLEVEFLHGDDKDTLYFNPQDCTWDISTYITCNIPQVDGADHTLIEQCVYNGFENAHHVIRLMKEIAA